MSESANQSFAEGLDARGFRFAIVVSRFNSVITDRLLEGAMEALKKCRADMKNVDVLRIPGAFEFPITVRAIAALGRHDAIVCLGAVIRGDTPHFDFVAGEAARGIAQASADTGVPIAFGVLTTDSVDQAEDRAGGKAGNKGFDAAMTAIEMARLLHGLRAKH
jgi:6,7-dimethyl-8-ribityllumazine synthase